MPDPLCSAKAIERAYLMLTRTDPSSPDYLGSADRNAIRELLISVEAPGFRNRYETPAPERETRRYFQSSQGTWMEVLHTADRTAMRVWNPHTQSWWRTDLYQETSHRG